MKRILKLAIFGIAIIAAGCNKDNPEGQNGSERVIPAELKDGYWTDCLSRKEETGCGVIMKLSGEDAHFGILTFDKSKPTLVNGSVTYDSSSGTGTIVVPNPVLFSGEYDFTMLSEAVMQCTDHTKKSSDTLVFKYLTSSIEEWYEDRTKDLPDDYFNPAWACLARYEYEDSTHREPLFKQGTETKAMGWNIFNRACGGIGAICGLMGAVDNIMGWCQPSNQDLMDEILEVKDICNEMNGKLDAISQQITDMSVAIQSELKNIQSELKKIEETQELQIKLEIIGKQLDFLAWFQSIMEERDQYVDMVYTLQYLAHKKQIEECYFADKENESEYFDNLYSALKSWMGKDDKNLQRILNLVYFLTTEKSPDYVESGMPYVYDRIYQLTSAWEHEHVTDRLNMYLSDLSLACELTQWATVYLNCCIKNGDYTMGGGNPEYYLSQLLDRNKAMSEKYGSHEKALEVCPTRRVCYIYGAQFVSYTPNAEVIDYVNHPWGCGSVPATSVLYYTIPSDAQSRDCCFGFRCIGTNGWGEPSGWMDPDLLIQRLMNKNLLETLREFYSKSTPSSDFKYMDMLVEKGAFNFDQINCLLISGGGREYYQYNLSDNPYDVHRRLGPEWYLEKGKKGFQKNYDKTVQWFWKDKTGGVVRRDEHFNILDYTEEWGNKNNPIGYIYLEK